MIGYLFGATMVVLGVLLLLGVLVPSRSIVGGSDLARTIFGIVLVLYGIFRVASTWSRSNQQNREGGHRPGIGL